MAGADSGLVWRGLTYRTEGALSVPEKPPQETAAATQERRRPKPRASSAAPAASVHPTAFLGMRSVYSREA